MDSVMKPIGPVMGADLQPAEEPLRLRGPVVAGLIILLLFFGSFGVWAVLAPLKSAAIAPGELTVDTKRKTVQHLEGGIIAAIKVTEGQEVAKGDVLFELKQTRSESELESVKDRLYADLALEARLVAERDKAKKVVFPKVLTEQAEYDDDIKALMQGQVSIFNARRKSLRGQKAILRQRIAQFNSEKQGIVDQISSQNEQELLLVDEEQSLQQLFSKGMVGKSRLRELQRQLVELKGARSKNEAAISGINQSITEARLQIVELETKQLNEVVQELRDTQTEILALQEKIRALDDVLQRTDVRAPISGVVVNLRVTTVGGVVAPGEPLVDIVPKDERLIVEARVDPIDIDVVNEGLEALVRFTSFSQRNIKPAPGHVLTVSADRFTDERTGSAYFLARIVLDEEANDMLKDLNLTPGMPVEVMIVTGEQTPLEYFLKPIKQSFNRALRES